MKSYLKSNTLSQITHFTRFDRMKHKTTPLTLLIMLSLVVGGFVFFSHTTSSARAQTQTRDYNLAAAPIEPGQFVVKYKPGKAPADLQAAISQEESNPTFLSRIKQSLGIKSSTQVEYSTIKALEDKYSLASATAMETYNSPTVAAMFDNTYIYTFSSTANPTALLADYNAMDAIEYIEPNYIYSAFKVPNDTEYGSMWGMKIINAEAAWEQSTGLATVKAAVVDTGVETTHSDLKANVLKSEGIGAGCSSGNDTGNHGSHVAGTIGAVGNNAKGVVGVNWTVSISGYAVLCAGGSGSIADIAAGINKAVADGNKVVNLSLGGPGDSTTLHNAIINAKRTGTTVAVAAGNCWNQPQSGKCPDNDPAKRGSSDYTYPAAYPEAITVAATTSTDESASFSNRGNSVDIAAPGYQIKSSWPPDTYNTISGTSMATPHVAGAIALLLSIDATLTPDQIQNALQCTAKDLGAAGWDTTFGHGRLDLKAAVDAVKAHTIPTCPVAGQPVTTPIPTSAGGTTPGATTPAPTAGAGVHPCPAEAAKGNYNCTMPIDDNDYKAWETEFKSGTTTLAPYFEYVRKALYQ